MTPAEQEVAKTAACLEALNSLLTQEIKKESGEVKCYWLIAFQ